jgi:hypothetical protein
MRKWLILLLMIVAGKMPAPQAANFPVSGNLDIEGCLRFQGIYVDTTGKAAGGALTLNATMDTARFIVGAGSGDITGVTAGTGLKDGGTTGTVTLNIVNLWGLTIGPDSIGVDTALVATRATLEDSAADLRAAMPDSTDIAGMGFVAGGGADGQNADSIRSKVVSRIAPTDQYILKWDTANDSIIWAADEVGAPGAGDIEGVTAGDGLGGGGTSGTVTLGILTLWGLNVTDDTLRIDTTEVATQADIASFITAGQVPAAETDAAHDNFSELGGAASDGQVPNDITIDTTNANDTQWDQYIEQHQAQVGDYLDPADSAGVAYRAWVSSLDFLDPADSAGVAYRTWVSAQDGARADSSTALYWPDSTAFLTYAKALIGARADSSLSLYWPDSTALLTYVKAQIALKSPIDSPTFTGTVTIPTPFTLGAVSVLPTGTELNFVDGVTSAIQTQFGGKADTANVAHRSDSTTYAMTQTMGALKANLASPTFTGTVTMPTPFTLAAVSVLPTGTELNFVDGVTSAIQTQLNKKLPEINIDNPLHLTYDTTAIFTAKLGTYTIDSVWSTTCGSVDNYDFTLVEIPAASGAVAVVEAIQVTTEIYGAWRRISSTAIDDGSIAVGNKVGFVQSADSTDAVNIILWGHY